MISVFPILTALVAQFERAADSMNDCLCENKQEHIEHLQRVAFEVEQEAQVSLEWAIDQWKEE